MALIPDATITFDLDGERRTLSMRRVKFGTWIDLKKETGFTPLTLMEAAGKVDVEAIAALVWLERRDREPVLQFQNVCRAFTDDTTFQLVDIVGPSEDDAPEEPDPTIAGTGS